MSGAAAGAMAWFDGLLATDPCDSTKDLSAVDSEGWWAVVVDFEGHTRATRFRSVQSAPAPDAAWPGVPQSSWRSSLNQHEYEQACEAVRSAVVEGDVYQANICRVLSAPMPRGGDVTMAGLHAALKSGNPAPYAGFVDTNAVRTVSASPELYLSVKDGVIASGPIKGTGRVAQDLLDKDTAENIMITDLVRNDLSLACEPGSLRVPQLLRVEQHPGLVHLVTTVQGQLRADVTASAAITLTFPPGSVSGAPKYTAVKLIEELETTPRGPYCGAIGYVDADAGTVRLAVGIRSFYERDGQLCFGTGAGITYDSDPTREWEETELKAANLIRLAAQAHSL